MFNQRLITYIHLNHLIMKRVYFLISLLMLAFGSTVTLANDAASTINTKKPAVHSKSGDHQITANEAKVMVERIHEIRDMDKSNLTKNERAELRKELKDMKQSIRKDGGYIVIGTGTLVLIIILILLLT